MLLSVWQSRLHIGREPLEVMTSLFIDNNPQKLEGVLPTALMYSVYRERCKLPRVKKRRR